MHEKTTGARRLKRVGRWFREGAKAPSYGIVSTALAGGFRVRIRLCLHPDPHFEYAFVAVDVCSA